MNIAFCINNAYASKAAVVMFSLLENHKDTYINFYIFSSDLTDDSLNNLNKLHKKHKNFTVSKIDVPAEMFKDLKSNVDYISIEAYYRYAIADLLPGVDKILYMDVDLVVDKNINEFYNIDLENYYLVGVEDSYVTGVNHKPEINMAEDDLYVNSGVLLMNLPLIRRDGLCNKFIQTTKDLWGTTQYVDQDIINIICKGKIKQVDNIYNFLSKDMEQEPHKVKDVCIIHFAGANKPWKKRKIKRGHIIKFWRWKKYFFSDTAWEKYIKHSYRKYAKPTCKLTGWKM